MVVWVKQTIFLILFQMFLAVAIGHTLPINTVTDKQEPFETLQETVERSSVAEDITNIRLKLAFHLNYFSSLDISKLPMVMIPNFDSCFKQVLNYAQECASKYSCYNKMQPFRSNEFITDSSLLSITPFFSASTAIDESTPSLSSSVKLPFKASDTSSLDPFSTYLPFDIENESTKYLSPCFDLSYNLPETKPPILMEPLPYLVALAPSKSVLQTEPVDLTKTSCVSAYSPIPYCPLPPVPTSLIVNSNPSRDTPLSTLILPLSLSNTITSLEPAHGYLPSESSNTQSLPINSLSSPSYYLYEPSSNTLLNPTTQTISSSNSLSSIPIPYDPNCCFSGSLAPFVSNYLPLSPQKIASEITDSFLLNDIPYSSIHDTKSFKRSTNNVEKLGPGNSSANTDSINHEKKKLSTENSDKLNSGHKSVKMLRELLYLLEILSKKDTCDWDAIHTILSVLTD